MKIEACTYVVPGTIGFTDASTVGVSARCPLFCVKLCRSYLLIRMEHSTLVNELACVSSPLLGASVI